MIFLGLLDDIKDIKGPVEFPANYLFFIIIGIAALAAGIFALSRLVLKKIKRRKEFTEAFKKGPHQIAYESLAALKAKNLPAAGRIKEFYYELSDIARTYIEGRFNIKAPEMTTEEFLSTLKNSAALSAAHKALLKEFLYLCDIVKFAKYGPTQKEIDESFNAAIKLVDETKTAEEEKESIPAK